MNAEGKKKAKGGKGGVQLFQPMTLRGVTMRNRIWLPPMDTYLTAINAPNVDYGTPSSKYSATSNSTSKSSRSSTSTTDGTTSGTGGTGDTSGQYTQTQNDTTTGGNQTEGGQTTGGQ